MKRGVVGFVQVFGVPAVLGLGYAAVVVPTAVLLGVFTVALAPMWLVVTAKEIGKEKT